MKSHWITLQLLLVSLLVEGQRLPRNIELTANGPFVLADDMTARVESFVNGHAGNLRKNSPVEGNYFLDENWHSGFIRLKDGPTVQVKQLRFNAHDNTIWFKKDSIVLVLQTPAIELGYRVITERGVEKNILLRCGYPSAAGQSARQFYEVLVEGPFSLLKRHAKKLIERPTATGVPGYRVVDHETHFLFDSTVNQIYELGLKEHAIYRTLPLMEKRIKSILERDNFKLSSEADLVKLVERLND